MLSALHSGAGKTVFTCALLTALKRRGLAVRAFKCGPDYIDPMFHTRVVGVPSRNLDLFLQGPEGVRRTLGRGSGDVAVLEGAMGFYDGIAGTARASAWDISRETDTPAVLVLRPRGVGITLAAQVRGVMDFRPDSRVAGLVLTDCGERLADYLKPVLERETGLPVLGHLPPLAAAAWESRHLGLYTAGEVSDWTARLEELAGALERTVDIDGLLALAAEQTDDEDRAEMAPEPVCRIAAARDAAFCFSYEENFDRLRQAGAELVWFSPLKDEQLPDRVDGLYLVGGYPELYAKALAENRTMRESVAGAVRRGLPTVAECGGFLYLQRTLEDAEGTVWPMCGALPGAGVKTGRLQRFGYHWLEAETDSLLFRRGERVPVHEFHYWDCTENGADLGAEKPDGRQWRCGRVSDVLYAAFPHLHFGGALPLAERFVAACVRGSV
jgi:cobyrinic acid a,c-diamide synthase